MQTGSLTVKGWPEGKIPSEIPEYKEGEVVNSGGDSREYTILVDKTNREDLDGYLDVLDPPAGMSEGMILSLAMPIKMP